VELGSGSAPLRLDGILVAIMRMVDGGQVDSVIGTSWIVGLSRHNGFFVTA